MFLLDAWICFIGLAGFTFALWFIINSEEKTL